jgi:hypothetical protein
MSMAVSERDRAYMRRLGTYKAAAHADAQARHRELPMSERLRRSWALYEAHRHTLPPVREDDPTPFYDRARALGFYRP